MLANLKQMHQSMDTGRQLVQYQVLWEIPLPEQNTVSRAGPTVENSGKTVESPQQPTVSVVTEILDES